MKLEPKNESDMLFAHAEIASGYELLIVPIFRGSSRFESLVLSQYFRFQR